MPGQVCVGCVCVRVCVCACVCELEALETSGVSHVQAGDVPTHLQAEGDQGFGVARSHLHSDAGRQTGRLKAG